MARQIVVDIVGDATKFNRAADGAVKKVGGLNTKLGKLGDGLKFGAGVAAFAGVSLGVSTLIGVLGDADAAFREDQVRQEKLKVALKNNVKAWDGNTQAIEDYAAAQGDLGFSDDEVRDAIGQFVGVTHDVAEAIDLNNLAMDLARAKSIPLAQAVDIVTKAHEGNGKALRTLGVDIGDAKTAAELLDAVQKNVRGSAEKWAETSDGKLAKSQVKVGEAMEKIGAAVDKLAVVLLPALADAFTVAVDVIAPLMSSVVDIVKTLVSWIQNAIGLIDTLTGKMPSVPGSGGFDIGGVVRNIVNVTPLGAIPLIGNLLNSNSTSSGGYVSGHRAVGGPVEAGKSYLVGEQGPELLQMGGRGGNITPNSAMRGGAVLVFNFNGPVYGDGPFLDELSNRIAQRLRYATGR